MSNDKRRSSNIGDLLKRKSSLLNTDLDINILDEIENIVVSKASSNVKSRPGATIKDKALSPAVDRNSQQKATSSSVEKPKLDETPSKTEAIEKSSTIEIGNLSVHSSQNPALTSTLTGHLELVNRVSLDRAMYYLMLKELAENGILNMSQVRIAKILNTTELTIKRTLKELEEVGLLIRTHDHSSQHARTYSFNH